MRLRDVSIGTQLRLGGGAILLLVTVVGAVSWLQGDRLWQETQGIYDHPFTVTSALGKLTADVLTVHLDMRALVQTEGGSEREALISDIDAREADGLRQLDILRRGYLGPLGDVEAAGVAFVRWRSIRQETIRLLRAGQTAEAIDRAKAGGVGGIHMSEVLGRVEMMSDFAANKAIEYWTSAKKERETLRVRLAVTIGAILLLTLGIGYALMTGVKQPLDEVTSAARRFQEGDLDSRSGFVARNEFGTLSAAFNRLAATVQSELRSRESVATVARVMLAEEELHSFCRELLEALIEHTGSQIGAVYLLNERKTEFEHFDSVGLSPAGRAAFAADGLEGELGAAVATRRIRRITDIPADSRFTFAAVSGSFVPREIITIPVEARGEVVAVVSLASVSAYSPQAVRLVDDAWSMITARMNGVLAFRRTQSLAEQLGRQNVELEAQKSELSAQAVELQRQAETLHDRNLELEVQTARVAEANRLKSEFLSNMSHELRTPLNSVLALSRVLQMQGRERFTPEETSYLEIIERNGKHLLSLINDLLDLAKIESGRLEIACEELSLGEQIGGIAESLEPLCREKGIALVVNVGPGLPALWSDRRRIRQILQNVVGNAVKFTREGQVSVTARAVGREVEIVVADTGIGIPENDLPHVFDEFRQVDGTAARSFEGTGLGLAIASKSARLLGGRIAVRSTLGVGSTFTIVLPLRDPAADLGRSPEGSAAAATASARTVLVVDDDPRDAGVIASYLAGEGYDVLTAHSGEEALRIAETHRPFAITLDVIMPGMDGWEVLQALKAKPATALIPVIIVSISEDCATGLALGAIGVVSKPVSRDALLAEVRRVAPPGPASVLVVDDNDLDRRLMTGMLHGAGFHVHEAHDGPAALKQVAAHRPDVVALDLVMPGMSGFEVLDALRGDPGTRQLPVVIVTAHDLTPAEREHLLGRVASVVEKSRLSSGDLLAEIGRILERLGKTKAARSTHANRLLLVEDSEPAIAQIRVVLEAEGYVVDVARGGMEALASMEAATPDGIILDLMMPGMDGLAVLERMRSTPATAATPVLILTAKDLTRGDLARLSANNVRQLIQKGDVDRDELLRQVARLLGRDPAAGGSDRSPSGGGRT